MLPYMFYLWLLGPKIKLARITVKELEKNIPHNQGSGEWLETKIPFSAFSEKFEDVDLDIVDSQFLAQYGRNECWAEY